MPKGEVRSDFFSSVEGATSRLRGFLEVQHAVKELKRIKSEGTESLKRHGRDLFAVFFRKIFDNMNKFDTALRFRTTEKAALRTLHSLYTEMDEVDWDRLNKENKSFNLDLSGFREAVIKSILDNIDNLGRIALGSEGRDSSRAFELLCAAYLNGDEIQHRRAAEIMRGLIPNFFGLFVREPTKYSEFSPFFYKFGSGAQREQLREILGKNFQQRNFYVFSRIFDDTFHSEELVLDFFFRGNVKNWFRRRETFKVVEHRWKTERSSRSYSKTFNEYLFFRRKLPWGSLGT